jgi:hypothetical protein
MENQKDSPIAVKATGSNLVGTHMVDDEPIAVLDGPASTFVRELSQSLGTSRSWTLDLIVTTYAKTFGFDPPPGK